jgi:hypothetical protein
MSQIVESVSYENWASESTVENKVIKNVLLCGNLSKNGYPIPPSAFGDDSKTKALYENKLVFVNHLKDPSKSSVMNRSIEDSAGYIRNVRKVNGKPYGDIYTEGMPKGEMVLNLAANKVPGVGMSHCGSYRWNKNTELGTYVESVEEIFTVDVVMNPATTKTFFEQTGVNQMSEVLEKQLITVQEEKKTLLTEKVQLENKNKEHETKLTDLQKRFDQLTQENTQLKSKVDAFETEKALLDRRVKIESELVAAELDIKDEIQVSKTFLESLQNEKDETKRQALIQDRVSLVKKVKETMTEGTKGAKERTKPNQESWNASDSLKNLSMI